ncbi:hypothetical protein E1267_24690 [Nonomuraea longispora]|uniref:ABC transporter permease n=1 Tax=Nonomuraea longispora TaxID=1848320 RepID=A0A4R4N979_9ACTN|nr:hypothetical protein [Nonomuraea longispora]TDC03883.1 hypothetical protein E1267_24690 [Nonomuraea longispora]
MIPLAGFRMAAYVRSHRVYQALLLALALLAILYGSRAPKGEEASVLTDGAVLIVPVLAWAARSLLDTEPDRQREMSAIQAGGRGREVAAGLVAAFTACAGLAAIALGWALLLGVSATPPPGVLLAVIALYVLTALAGTVLGALTSRAIVRSPAASIMAMLLGFLATLLVSTSPLYWLTVPLIPWMRAASAGDLLGRFPGLAALSLLWCLIGLAGYVLRRLRTS